MCPKTQELDYMSKVPYALAISSLLYTMVCTRLDIALVVVVVIKFMNNPEKSICWW